MHTWSATITVSGSDVTARCVGDLTERQEVNAAAVATLTLRATTSDIEAEREALEGAAVAISVAWDGDTARPWFAGYVQSATLDATTWTISLLCTDRLQEWAEAQDEATIDAAVTGSKRRASIQRARTTGWDQLLDCLKTVQADYAIGRDGVHRCTAWAPGTVAATLTASDIIEDGIQPAPVSNRERINTVVWTVEVRAPILYEHVIEAGFGVGQTFCQWNARQWVPIPIDTVAQAVSGANAVYRPQGVITLGAGTDAGINYTRFPPAGTINCGGSPISWSGGQDQCMAAAWKWRVPWTQTLTISYGLILYAPLAIAAHGALTDERRASVDAENAYADWESSASGTGRPSGTWDSVHGAARLIAIDATAEAADIESALAEGAAAIIGSYRDRYVISALPWTVQDLDLHHSVRVNASPWDITGKLSAIEKRLSIEDWSADATLTVRRRRGPAGTVTPTPLTAPERPSIPADWTLVNDITFPVHIGGDADSPALDGSERGVFTNYYIVDTGAPVYDYRCAFERPAVPDAARDALTAAGVANYTVHIPRD